MRKPGLSTVLALTIAIIAISSSAPMIAYCAAPALAIAFWRNALGVAAIAPFAAARQRTELRALIGPGERRALLGCVLAGLWLAVHFGTWVPSAKLTNAAMATALVNTTPVWTALLAVLRRVHVPVVTWVGIGISLAGTALAAGLDIHVSPHALLGDGLALAGGFAAAVYTTIGERVRASVSTTAYTLICYSVCAVVLLGVSLIGGVRLHGYTGVTWLLILAMTAGPQLLGHSLFNFSLKRVSATTIAVLLLLEVPGAAFIAWLFLGQLPAARTVPGLVLLIAGVAVVLVGSSRRPQPTKGGTTISPEAIATT